MKKLYVSPDLALPIDTVTGSVVVYGNRGMGKSNFGSVLCEELSKANLHFAVIDPMGVLYGLQSSKDGKGPGIPVLLLGGIHGDIPIEPTAGAVCADLVVDENVSVVIDISRHVDGKAWSKGEKVRFVTAYTTRLYERQVEQSRPLLQIYDEAARYVPQKFNHGDSDSPACMGAISMLVEEGRNIGVGVLLLTQRSARINKDVVELCECMIAFRTTGPNSIGAVTDWLGSHVDAKQIRDMSGELRKLPVGSALVVSPGWLEFEGVVRFRERETFDSSKTPKPGERRLEPVNPAKPDLTKYRELMKATVEKALANDPKKLKGQLAEAQREIARLRETIEISAPAGECLPPMVACDHEPLIRELYSRLERADKIRKSELEGLWNDMERISDDLMPRRHEINSFFDSIGEGVTELRPALPPLESILKVADLFVFGSRPGGDPASRVREPAPAGVVPIGRENSWLEGKRAIPKANGASSSEDVKIGVKSCATKLLIVLAQHGPCDQGKLSMLSGYSYNGSFRTALSNLRRGAYMVGENTQVMEITEKGRQYLIDLNIDTRLPTGSDLRNWWLDKMGKSSAAREFLQAFFSNRSGLTADRLSEITGYPYNGSFRTALSNMRRAGVLIGKNTEIMRANPELFQS